MLQKGFSLVELSVVLVILTLLVAGVSGGNKLVEHAQIRNAILKANNFQMVFNSFFMQYNAVAGDMANAYDYFTNCGDAGTENGQCDGDGFIEYGPENHKAWRNFNLAGMLPGMYSGVQNGSAPLTVAGDNVPESGIKKGGCFSWEMADGSSWSQSYGSGRAQILNLGSALGANGSDIPSHCFGGGLLSPAHARNIDKKIDDGLPSSGDIMSRDDTLNNNIANTAPSEGLRVGGTGDNCYSSGKYSAGSGGDIGCALFFKVRIIE